jgi:hypothetical protein
MRMQEEGTIQIALSERGLILGTNDGRSIYWALCCAEIEQGLASLPPSRQ